LCVVTSSEAAYCQPVHENEWRDPQSDPGPDPRGGLRLPLKLSQSVGSGSGYLLPPAAPPPVFCALACAVKSLILCLFTFVGALSQLTSFALTASGPVSKQTRDRIKDVLRDVGDDQRSLGGSAAELQTEEDANKWATDWERWIESRDQQWAAAAKNQQESRAETPQGWGQEMRSKSRGRQTAKEVSIKPAGPADGNGSGKDKERAMSHETRDRVDKLLKYFDGRHPYVHKSAAKLSTEEEAGKWAASMEEWIKSSRRAKSLLPETQMGQK